MKKYLNLISLLFLLSLVFLLLAFNLMKSYHLTINANDFSIYQQAIYDIASGISFNPYLSIRNVQIFNDHADPAVFFAAAFVKIFGFDSSVLLIFEWLSFVLFLFFVYYLAYRPQKGKKIQLLILLMFLALFCRAFLEGLQFPIHPTTWSILPLFLLTYFIQKKQFKGVFFSALFLCLFRESYPFAIIGLSFFYLLQRKPFHFFSLFFLGLSYVFIFIYLRPRLLGPVVDYGQTLMRDLFNHPFSLVFERFQTFNWQPKFLLPPLVLFIWMLKHEVKSFSSFMKHPALAVLFFISPLLFLHILANYFVHHHPIIVVTPLLSLIFLSSLPQHILSLPWKSLALVLVLYCSPAFSRYTRIVTYFMKPPISYAKAKEKSLSLAKLNKIVGAIPKDKTILATGGVIQAILRPGQKLYQFVDTVERREFFDYLLLEGKYHGDLNPLEAYEVNTIERNCRKQALEFLYEDEFFILMKGPFRDDCLGITKKWPEISPLVPKATK